MKEIVACVAYHAVRNNNSRFSLDVSVTNGTKHKKYNDKNNDYRNRKKFIIVNLKYVLVMPAVWRQRFLSCQQFELIETFYPILYQKYTDR